MAIGSTGTTSASFAVPSSIGAGSAKVQVVSNGISSKPVKVQISSGK
jgi:hypothetical protein